MARVTRFKGLGATNDGYFCGVKNSENALVQIADFQGTSAAGTSYFVSPFKGNLIGAYVCCDSSARTTTFTMQLGSAGTVMATATMASGVAGTVSVFTLGTVAITAGASFSVTNAAMGSAGNWIVVAALQQTA